MSEKNIIYFFLSLGLVFTTFILSKRISLEKRFKTIEIACDFDDVRNLAAISGKSVREVFGDLKAVGITTIGIKEATISNLEKFQLVTVASGSDIEKWRYLYRRVPNFLEAQQIENNPDYVYTFCRNPSMGSFIKDSLVAKLPRGAATGTFVGKYYLIIARAKKISAKRIHLGFFSDEINFVKAMGMRFVLRPASDSYVNEKWEEKILSQFSGDKSLSGVLIDGDKTPVAPEIFSHILKKNKLLLGTVEFTKPEGLEKTVSNLGLTFLCFSPKGENNLDKIDAISRSARERDIQMVYLHPGKDSYNDFLSFTGSVSRILKKNKFRIAAFRKMKKWSGNYFALVFMGLAIYASVYWLLAIIFKLSRQFKIVFVILSIGSVLFFAKSNIFRNFLAFLATVTFPVLAISKTWKKHRLAPAAAALSLFFRVSLISCIGGLFVSGILSSSDYMLKIDIFRGVKLSLVLPIFLAFILLYGRERSYFTSSLNRLWHKRLELRHLFIGLLIAVLFVFLVLRSSNQTGFLFPGEREIRDLLEKIFFARPRFKEFLFGHPLLILGFYFYLIASKREKMKFRPYVIFGLIGQVSIINTFAHIHSPITICLFRTFNGIVLGAIFGIILIYIVRLLQIIEFK